MYLRTGLGQPRQHKLVSLKSCSEMQPVTCAQWNFTVPFRTEFEKFRKEVRQAVGKRVTFRSDRGAFVDRFLEGAEIKTKLSELYNDMRTSGVNESSPHRMLVTIKYAPRSKKELEFTIP
jgi:hypothetical protein